MSEESLMILTLLREGKVSAAEAERLLHAVRETAPPSPPPAPSPLEQAAALAGRALEFFPKSKVTPAQVGAAWQTARDVAAEVGKYTRQTRPPSAPPGPVTDAPRPPAQATETGQSVITWSGSGPQGEITRLALVNPYGGIRVTGQVGPAGTAQATVTKTAWAETDSAARVLLQQVFLVSRVDAGVCRVELVAPPDAAGRVTVDYEIAVPPTAALDVQTLFGPIHARDTHCGQELALTSRSGDITADGGSAGATIRVEAQSGNVRLSRLRAAQITATATSGGLTVREVSGALTLKTTGGAITAEALNTPALAVTTANGDARLSFAAPFSGAATVQTAGGALTVALWDNSDTQVDLTTVSGTLSCALPLTDRTGDDVTRLAGRLGDGIGSLKLHSASGPVSVQAQR